MRTEEGSVSEVTASRSSRERNITTEQNLQNCSSTSTHGIVAQLDRALQREGILLLNALGYQFNPDLSHHW